MIKKKKKSLLDDIDTKEWRFAKISMDLAVQINAYLKKSGLSQKRFAIKLNRRESQVSKWLSGNHNFTVRTLADIEATLEKDLFIIPLDLEKQIKGKETTVSVAENIKNWVVFSYPTLLNKETGKQKTMPKMETKNLMTETANFRINKNKYVPLSGN